jgi:hypothetical protein
MPGHDPLATATTVSPLTVLVRGVLEWAFPADALDRLFAEHADAQYTRQLTLGAVVWLLLQAVAGARRSVFAAFQADQAGPAPTIAASYQALYAKVGRTDPPVATALVRHSAQRLRPLLAAARPTVPGWRGYQVRILDGTDLDGTEHRLKVLRATRAAGLPGRLVVEYDLATGVCTDAVASEDAYASEMGLVGPLVARAGPGRLYVADRNFCTWDILSGLARRGARFVIREHQKLRVRTRGRPRRGGRGETGEVWQQRLWVEDRHTGRRRAVRRVILKLDQPTRDGETQIQLLTNLPARVDAVRVTELYRRRWTLEGHFDFVKNHLHGEIETLGRPRAALLMLCLALVAANALAVVRQALRAAHGIDRDDLSGYYLADEVAANYRAVDVLVPQARWDALAARPAAACWAWCRAVAAQVRPAAFRRHPRGRKRPPPKRASGKTRPHYSTYRLLTEAKRRC